MKGTYMYITEGAFLGRQYWECWMMNVELSESELDSI
jgi:hypothetical protein